jgi:hypothetical protein
MNNTVKQGHTHRTYTHGWEKVPPVRSASAGFKKSGESSGFANLIGCAIVRVDYPFFIEFAYAT